MSEEKTVKCPICGEPYKAYPFYAGDQSACPDCVQKAAAKAMKPQSWQSGRTAPWQSCIKE